GVGGLPEGAAPAGLPVQLRGVGPAGAAGVAGLPAVPAEPGTTGVPGAARPACGSAAGRLAAAPGEELAGTGCQTPAAAGGATGAAAAGGVVSGPTRERPGLRPAGFGQDAPVECDRPGAGACGAEGEFPQVRPAGAGTAGGQARPEAAPAAQESGGL